MNSNSPLKTKVPPSEVNGGDLQQVLNDYQSRTAGSKAIAERYRAHHVDKSSIRGKTNTALATLDYPIVIGGAQGAYLRDIDGNQYHVTRILQNPNKFEIPYVFTTIY